MAVNMSRKIIPRGAIIFPRFFRSNPITLNTSRCLSQRCSLFRPTKQLQFYRIGEIKLNNYQQHAYSLSNANMPRSAWFSTNNKSEEKPSLFQRFKQMYRDYWYVLLPVHLVTSAAWFGGFYYLAKSGIDIVGILESWDVSERITNPLKDSSMGYIAVAYACYKIATPIRYTVTLGGTTISINYLKQFGYIKPVPSRQELKDMYMERKENIIETMKDKKEELKMKSEILRDKTDNLMDGFEKKIKDKIKDSKDTFRDGKENLSNLGKIKLKTKS